MNSHWNYASIVPAATLLLLSGCAGITPLSTWRAAVSAAQEPASWAPLVAAAVLSLEDMDKNLSDWAAHKNPVFDSIHDADAGSDDLRRLSGYAMLATTAYLPDNGTGDSILKQKSKRLVIEGIGLGLAGTTTNFIKDATSRTRPNGFKERSLPSMHTTEAFAYRRFTASHIDRLNLEPSTRSILNAGMWSMAAGTGWARVEAERHFVTDVLVGASVGNFFAAFTENLLDPWLPAGMTVSAQLSADRIAFGLNMAVH